ncbi:MAG: hypothetical protein ABI388_06645 [Bacteroidia bacterium]
MKKTRIITLSIVAFIFSLSISAQNKSKEGKPVEIEKKFFYRDTTFEFNGNKYDITRIVSAENYFKCAVNVTNISDNFIVINPADIFGSSLGSDVKTVSVVKRTAVIAPKFSKKFTIKLEGKDFRANEINIDITKMQLTGKMVASYPLEDINITKENLRQAGPVKWVMKEKKEDKTGYRIVAEVEYTGDKFLALFYNNIILKTADGGKYLNTGKKNEDFYYEMGKPFEKNILYFPVEAKKINDKNVPTLSFPNVFKEYSLTATKGPKFKVTKGTIDDFKGLNKKGDIDDDATDDK